MSIYELAADLILDDLTIARPVPFLMFLYAFFVLQSRQEGRVIIA